MIAIITACGANFSSIQFAIERLGKKTILTNNKDEIQSASHVIIPGVGSAIYGMDQLKKYQLIDFIPQLTQPVLGICLGMQILFDYSDEGQVNTLGIMRGHIKRIPQESGLVVPHMGWNQLQINKPENHLLKNIPQQCYFYFTHSYYAGLTENTLAQTEYGLSFSSIVNKNNFYGVQFHPELSSKMGEILLTNFLTITNTAREKSSKKRSICCNMW